MSENAEEKSLTREAIEKAKDRPVQKVPTPEWAGHVFVRTMSGLEANETRRYYESENMLALFAAMVCCDERGGRIFTPEDAEWLGLKSSNVLGRICNVAKIFNEIDAKTAKKTEKN